MLPTTAERTRWLSELEAEIDRLESIRAIQRLQRAFGYYVDRGLWDEAAELFADRGTLEVALDGVYEGKGRIREYLYALADGRRGLRYGDIHECLQLQPLVSVAEDRRSASARWRAFVLAGRFGASAYWAEGPCRNDYVREAGVWKLARLHAYPSFVVPYEGGWVHNADPTGGVLVSGRLPPDRPPSESYATWPGVYTPELQYTPRTTGGTSAAAAAHSSPGEHALGAALVRRIERLRDRAELENLIAAYGYCLDKQLWDQFTGLFAEDATMEISQRGVYVGRASIRRALELFGPQGIVAGHLHNHMQLQPVIHVAPDGRRAWVRSRALSQLGIHGRAGLWHGGVYENEFVKEDGVWRFKTDHVYTTFFALYEQGWIQGRAAPKASDTIPPDRPPSELYEAYPGVYIPPFHYPHPVTGRPIVAGRPAEAAMHPTHGHPAQGHPAQDDPGQNHPGGPRGASDRAELRALTARIERLEDAAAIENLQRTYGYFVDKGLWEDVADLFTAQGTLEIGGRGVFVGRERVLEYLRWLAPQGLTRGRLFDHLQLQPIISVAADGASARGRWRFFAQVGEVGKSALWGIGTYENAYVKEAGVWKIAALHSWFRMYTPYAEGWGRAALPLTRPEVSLPPDCPPSADFAQYPDVCAPPDHYPHPVSGR